MEHDGINIEKDLREMQADSTSTGKNLGFTQKCADYLRIDLDLAQIL